MVGKKCQVIHAKTKQHTTTHKPSFLSTFFTYF
jgi:hypothetical protein